MPCAGSLARYFKCSVSFWTGLVYFLLFLYNQTLPKTYMKWLTISPESGNVLLLMWQQTVTYTHFKEVWDWKYMLISSGSYNVYLTNMMSNEILYNEKNLRNSKIFFHNFLYWRLYCLSNNVVTKNFTYILGTDKNVIMKHCIHLLEYKFLEVFVWCLTANLHCIRTAEPCTMIFNN